jgi:hypothetical protein
MFKYTVVIKIDKTYVLLKKNMVFNKSICFFNDEIVLLIVSFIIHSL